MIVLFKLNIYIDTLKSTLIYISCGIDGNITGNKSKFYNIPTNFISDIYMLLFISSLYEIVYTKVNISYNT